VPDFEPTKAPHTDAEEQGEGMDAISGADPFIMNADGRGWLYAPHGCQDGPMPTHYEPAESPAMNALYPHAQSNPAMVTFNRPDNPTNPSMSQQYPYVITTYRLTEHHTSGAMSRWLSWLSELQPAPFVEISPALAAEKGIQTGDWVTVSTTRAEVEAYALVTERMQPLRIEGGLVHVVGMPYHWGPRGIVTGDAANDLVGVVLDPNVKIHEAKAFTCNLRKGRKSAGPPRAEYPPHAALEQGGTIGRQASEFQYPQRVVTR